jgi:hypothetical protein
VLVVLAKYDLRRTITAAVPAALLVAAAALAANHLAHGTIVPPYAHRADGMRPAAATAVEESWNPDNWYDYAIRLPNGRLLQSYWRAPQGIDKGEPSRAAYAWHAIAGHHGILSLTPAWLLVVPGLALLAARRRRHGDGEADVALAIAAVSAVVIVFYLLRPQADRNYGGMTSGFRWVFWMRLPDLTRSAGPGPRRPVVGQRCLHADALARVGIGVVDPPGMEQDRPLPLVAVAVAERWTAVESVAHDRQPTARRLHSKLVHAAGHRHELQQLLALIAASTVDPRRMRDRLSGGQRLRIDNLTPSPRPRDMSWRSRAPRTGGRVFSRHAASLP